jgi:plasmid stabilization system protein ParE
MEKGSRRIVWSATASRDLIDIWGYLYRVASPELADNFVREIHSAVDRIGELDPRMWRVRHDLMPELIGELRAVPVHPYAIFFRLASGDDIDVIRVLHRRRDVGPLLLDDRQ